MFPYMFRSFGDRKLPSYGLCGQSLVQFLKDVAEEREQKVRKIFHEYFEIVLEQLWEIDSNLSMNYICQVY